MRSEDSTPDPPLVMTLYDPFFRMNCVMLTVLCIYSGFDGGPNLGISMLTTRS
jgi:hypothetical protein